MRDLRNPVGATVVIAPILASCAIHPVPQDVTGISTLDIVKQIRCECLKAGFSSAVNWLVHDEDVDDASRAVGASFYNTNRPMAELHPKLFKGEVRRILDLFWETGIAYNYVFEMTETNNFNTEFNLLKTFTNSTSGLGLKAGLDRERQNVRTFTVTDTFSSLIGDVSDTYCDGRIVAENHTYPIAGRIGLDEVIGTFVNLTLHGGLGPDPKAPDGPPTMVEELRFTTTISGSATPSVTFAPLGKALRIADASITGDVKRVDAHKVTVGLALKTAVTAQLGPVRRALIRDTLFGRLLTASGGPTERAAAEAVDQVLTLRALDASRTIVINQ